MPNPGMSAKDLIQALEEECYNNNYRQNYGTWEACISETTINYDGIQGEGNNAGSGDAVAVIEGLGVATVTILGVICTVQAFQGRRGIWLQFRNGLTLIGQGVQYAINVVTRNENDLEASSSQQSSVELDVTPIRPRIIHYPPAYAPPQPPTQTTTQQPTQTPPQPLNQTPTQQPPQTLSQTPNTSPIQERFVTPTQTPIARSDTDDSQETDEHENAPLTMPNTPSPSASVITLKPDTEEIKGIEKTIEETNVDEETSEGSHDATIVPIESKISFDNLYLLNV